MPASFTSDQHHMCSLLDHPHTGACEFPYLAVCGAGDATDVSSACRIPKEDTEVLMQPKKQTHLGRVLRRCRATLPALTGALIAAAMAVAFSAQSTTSAKGAAEDVSVTPEEGKVGDCSA